MSPRTFLTTVFSVPILVVLLLVIVTGCASTGRGQFPEFYPERDRSAQDLAVLSPIGLESSDISTSLFIHLQKKTLENTFSSVRTIANREVGRILKDRFVGAQITPSEADKIRRMVDADWILAFYVHDLKIERFTETETRILYRTDSSFRTTNIIQEESDSKTNGRKTGPGKGPGRRVGPRKDTDSGNSSNSAVITSQTTRTTSREVPVQTGNIRVVLSMSALIYDTHRNEVIWRGKRIERAEGELKELSTVELQDIVIERVMYQIVNRLAQ